MSNLFLLLLFGAVLLRNSVNANINITCYECKGCKSTPSRISTNNHICYRIQMNCLAADVHIIDLTGDGIHANYSSSNCGHTRVYSTICTIAYHCCYTDRCNIYEIPQTTSSPPSSSSTSLVLEWIVISLVAFLHYH